MRRLAVIRVPSGGLWEQVEDQRWLGFWRPESRARGSNGRSCSSGRRTCCRASTWRAATLLDRHWIRGPSVRELVGGQVDLVEGWRDDLDRYRKGGGQH